MMEFLPLIKFFIKGAKPDSLSSSLAMLSSSSLSPKRLFVVFAVAVFGCVCSAFPVDRPRVIREESTDLSTTKISSAPALSNFAFGQNQRQPNTVSNTTGGETMEKNSEDTTSGTVHKLLNVPMNNGTGTVFLNINLQKMMEDPYVHGVVLPAAVGVIVALLTLLLVCSIRSCVRSQARKRRKRRIRNLAEELKADQKVLLTADSDDEI